MDLIKLMRAFWNMFFLFLFFLPGTILEKMEKSTLHTRKNLQLDAKTIKSMEAIRNMASTAPSLFSTVLTITTTPTKAILLSSLTTIAKKIEFPTESINLMSTKQNIKSNRTEPRKHDNHYNRPKKTKRNMKVTTGNTREMLNSHMKSESATISTKLIDEYQKLYAVAAIDFSKKSYAAQEHFYSITEASTGNDKTLPVLSNTSTVLEQRKMLANPKLTNKNSQDSVANIFDANTHVNLSKDLYKLEQPTMSNSSVLNELFISSPKSFAHNISRIIQNRNSYDGGGQIAINVQSAATKRINSLSRSNPGRAILETTTATSTTSKLSTLARKQNHMYDNNNALSYLPYQSAALRASPSNTLNNNLNMYTSSGSSGSIIGYNGSSSSSSSLKRDTLMSVSGIISTAKAAVVDNSFMRNSTNTHAQKHTDDDEENALKVQFNFKSTNSSVHETQAMKQISQTPTTTTTATAIAINEMSSSSPSLPFNVSSTYSVISTAVTKEIPSTTAKNITITSTPRTTLRSTTRRRKIATTTLKPPPTIDDYQTITSQAGTHAYLPCNVKQLVKKPISWLRVRDGHILTVDQTTFIADQRFQSIYTTNPERWSLQIKYVQLKDAGIYECQVSTEPKASAIIYLHVVEPKTELIGAPTRHVKAGSQVKLLCVISQALEPPLFINWFYNQKQIYLHNRKGWHTEIERIELPPETTTTTTTTTTATSTAAPLTTTTTTTTTTVPSLSSSLSTSSSMLNGSEISAMHVFTSIAPQQSLNDDNLLELVSESTYNNYANLMPPEVASVLTTQNTQQIQSQTTTTIPSLSSPSSSSSIKISKIPTSESTVMEKSTTTTLPAALPAAVTTTTLTLDIDADDNNDDDEHNENDYKTNPTATTFETAEAAIAAGRGYMMLSSLMTFTDVKQITTASLIIPSVQKQDSGNYTCSPSNSEPRTVILHVLNGEYSASAITSAALNKHIQHKFLIFNLSIFILNNSIFRGSVIFTQYVIRRYSGG